MHSREESIQKLQELIKDVKIAMLATVDRDGSIHSRPMATQQFEFDGDLWFFTNASSHKVDEIDGRHAVNVIYAKPDDQKYVSVSGDAALVHDAEKARELWNPIYKAWFPKGLDDPDLALLKVTVHKAEFWDTPSGAVVQLIGFLKAVATGKTYSASADEHSKLRID